MGKVYVWICPVCGRELVSVSKTQLINNASIHLQTHKIFRKVDENEIMEAEVIAKKLPD